MANPYSRPVRYKYQPINVGILAQPLAQQQAAYDQQTALIDNTSFDIKALDSDSEVVKKKKEALQASLDEMSKDLLNTKDFRSASRKLAKLNKFYTTSDEIQSHQQNYAQYQQHKADLQKRVEKGKISQGDADLALQVSLGEFDKKGGTNYDANTGDYNKIGLATVSNNMDKEIAKYADKMAKANKADSIAYLKHLSQEGLLDAEKKDRLIKKVLENNSKDEISRETYNALINSDRFKEYLDNKADLEVRASRLNPNFSTTIYSDSIDRYNNEINALQKAIVDGTVKGTLKDSDKKAAEERIKSLEVNRANLERSYGQNPTGTEDMLLRNSAVNTRLMNEAEAMGDIYAYTDLDYQIYGGNKKGKGSKNPLSSEGGMIIGREFADSPVADLNQNLKNTEEEIAINAEKLMNAEDSPISFNILDNLISPEKDSSLGLTTEEITNKNLIAFAKSPEVYTGQMNHVLQSFVDNKDSIEGFKEDLKGYGLNLDDAYVANLFDEFTKNPKALSDLDKSVTALGQQTTHLSNLKEYKKAIADTYLEEDKTKKFFNTIGDKKPQFFDTASSTSPGPSIAHLGTVFDPAEWGLDKKGAMTYNEVAQLAGYKNTQDAVAKGYDWETTGNIKQFDPSTISKWDKPMFTSMEDFIEDERKKWNDRQGKGKSSKQAKINPTNLFNYSDDERKGGVSKRENQVNVADAFERHKQFVVEEDPEKYLKESRIFSYVGNPKIEKRMEDIFGGTNDVLSLMTPVFGESWEDIPGFEGSTDPSGENKNGVFTAELKSGGNFTPSMIGDKLMFKVDYTYKNENEEDVDASVYVDFSPNIETNVLERQVTDAIIEGADNTEMGDLVRDAAYKMRFDERYPTNSLNNIYVDALSLPDGGSVILDKIPVSGSGKSGVYMSTVVEKDDEGNKVIRIKSGGAGKTGYMMNANTNKKLEFETAGQAKTYLSQAFLGAAKGKGLVTIPTYIQ